MLDAENRITASDGRERHLKVMMAIAFLFLAPVMLLAGFDLDSLRWQNRVVVVFAPDMESEDMSRQTAMLREDSRGFSERHMALVRVGLQTGLGPQGEKMQIEDVRPLRRRYNVSAGDFTVLLIGKDGGEKMRASDPLEPSEFHARIDSMPMRRSEMRSARPAGGAACAE